MVYDSYTTKRTQVYLDEHQVAKLRSTARATGQTVSEIIQGAIDDKLTQPAAGDQFDAALAAAVGVWAERKDLGSADEYVRKVGRDRRGAPTR